MTAYAGFVERTTVGGDVDIDRVAWQVLVDGQPIDLTYLEFEVLDYLVRNPGRVHSREKLLREVWHQDPDALGASAPRTVDVMITRLRRKLGRGHRDRIETVRRVGYRYRDAAEPLSSHSLSTR
ncbi:winged helix-turn-helix domain-containing protein [Parafrankia sp. EUN1f]|uniref:winged helix-turn-helix domain-containing protein n=1 Tax=Parafrankia sp. EUN1f TaxID=102897 RepID=UPI0001C467EF|nr:winged helix-turn-helix domain-containing protein [Parafrankia sp. EUN1f]EFC81026.1 putative two component transcriptional regulator, winged helix family [Parafrankia sp. EUN1f]